MDKYQKSETTEEGSQKNFPNDHIGFQFLYWDDPGDSHYHVDNRSDEDLREEYRMMIIMRNGNNGDHYGLGEEAEEK